MVRHPHRPAHQGSPKEVQPAIGHASRHRRRKGKTLKRGTYLLTITAGDVSVRTKVWVLAQ